MPKGRKRSLSERKISRRSMLKWTGALATGVVIGAGLEYGAAQILKPPVTVPGRMTTSPLTVWEALRNRKSTNGFQPQPLTDEKLLSVLWAAWGINRPDSGKRTAPTAMNAQEIDIYVLLPQGVYVYDAKGNQLTSVSTQDLRTEATTQESMKDAPVQLLFVADYAKFRRNLPQSQKELYSAAHTGFIGQNVYLYCASEGLGAHFYATIDRAALKDSLKLREDQAIVFAQAVGYPKI